MPAPPCIPPSGRCASAKSELNMNAAAAAAMSSFCFRLFLSNILSVLLVSPSLPTAATRQRSLGGRVPMDIAVALSTWNLWRCTRKGTRGSHFAMSELSRSGLVQVATIKDVQDRSPCGSGNKCQGCFRVSERRRTDNGRRTTDDRGKTRSSGVSLPSFVAYY